jgi:simple sugar transport system permease protein
MSETTAPVPTDERLVRRNPVARLVARPDTGALLAAVAVFAMFSIFAHKAGWLGWADAAQWTDQSAQYGIVAVPVALLMIGGEFDLSAGVMIGSSGLLLGLLGTRADLNIWPSIALVLLVGAVVGLINGVAVV